VDWGFSVVRAAFYEIPAHSTLFRFHFISFHPALSRPPHLSSLIFSDMHMAMELEDMSCQSFCSLSLLLGNGVDKTPRTETWVDWKFVIFCYIFYVSHWAHFILIP